VVDRSVVDFPDGVTKKVRLAGVRVLDGTTGREVFLTGPVDMARYHTIPFTPITNAQGRTIPVYGVSLKVTEVDGQPTYRDWNLISKRALTFLKPFLENGDYLKYVFSVTPVGAPPTTDYQIVPLP